MLKRPLGLVFLVFGVVPVFAQTSTSSTGWYQYFGDHPVTNRWGIHAEGQWRRDKVITSWEQLLLRSGLTYTFNEHVTVTLGYTYLRTYVYGELPRDASREHRIYQELKLAHSVRSIDWEQRFRVEQRFIAPERNGNRRFAERVRYRLQARVPMGASKVADGRVYLSFYDEFFVNFGPHGGPQALDQNRVYGALGFNLNGKNKLELGYLYRYFPPASGPLQQEHSLQVSIFSSSPLFK